MGWPLYMGLTGTAVFLTTVGAALWLQSGENLFVTRLFAAVAGCF